MKSRVTSVKWGCVACWYAVAVMVTEIIQGHANTNVIMR